MNIGGQQPHREMDESGNQYTLTRQEQAKLFLYHTEFGNRWTRISMLLNKNINTVKNHFYCSIRRGIRNINTFARRRKSKNQRYPANIKPTVIMKLMEVMDDKFSGKLGIQDNVIETCQDIKQRLLKASRNQNNTDEKELTKLRVDLYDFNKNYKRKRRARRSQKRRAQKQKRNKLFSEQNEKFFLEHFPQIKDQYLKQEVSNFNFLSNIPNYQHTQTLKYIQRSQKIDPVPQFSNISQDQLGHLSYRVPPYTNSNQINLMFNYQQSAVGTDNSRIDHQRLLHLYSTQDLRNLYFYKYNQINFNLALCNNIMNIVQERQRVTQLGFPTQPQVNPPHQN